MTTIVPSREKECATCTNYARFERANPKGESLECKDCGRRFRRVLSDKPADSILGLLLSSSKPTKR